MPEILLRLNDMSPICLTPSPKHSNPAKRPKLDIDRGTAAPKYPDVPIFAADVNEQNVDDIMEDALYASRNNSGNSTSNQTGSTFLEVQKLKEFPSYLQSSNDIMENNSSLFKGSTSTIEQSATETTITGQKDENETEMAEETNPGDKKTEVDSETKATDEKGDAPEESEVDAENKAAEEKGDAPEESEVAPETEATGETEVAEEEKEVQESQDEDDMQDDETKKVKSKDEEFTESDMEE